MEVNKPWNILVEAILQPENKLVNQHNKMLNGYLYSAIPMMLLEYSPTPQKIKNKIMSHSSRRYARHLLVKCHICDSYM